MIDPHVIWLRNQILERIRIAKAVRAVDGTWHAREPDSDGPTDVDDDSDRVAASAADGAIADHIAMNDPGTVVGTCLAELAILAEHRSSGAFASPAPAEEPPAKKHCIVCNTDYPCNTVRRLHDGYRRRNPW
jgi:Family of unknown function (DUF6221)